MVFLESLLTALCELYYTCCIGTLSFNIFQDRHFTLTTKLSLEHAKLYRNPVQSCYRFSVTTLKKTHFRKKNAECDQFNRLPNMKLPELHTWLYLMFSPHLHSHVQGYRHPNGQLRMLGVPLIPQTFANIYIILKKKVIK